MAPVASYGPTLARSRLWRQRHGACAGLRKVETFHLDLLDPVSAARLEAANQATASPVRPRRSWTRTRPPRFRARLRRGGRPRRRGPIGPPRGGREKGG